MQPFTILRLQFSFPTLPIGPNITKNCTTYYRSANKNLQKTRRPNQGALWYVMLTSDYLTIRRSVRRPALERTCSTYTPLPHLAVLTTLSQPIVRWATWRPSMV